MNTMNTEIHTEPPVIHLSEAAREVARRAADAAKDAANRATATVRDVAGRVEDAAEDASVAAKDAAKRATDTAIDLYQSAAMKAEDTLATSKEYVRRNPVPVVLGSIAFGAAIGYLVMMARRKPTFSERYAEDPMVAVREAILSAFAPVTQRVHEQYDSVRDGAGKVMDRVHHFNPGRASDSISDQIGRIGNNLKFW
jgi:ElaB/YqjD/DUF883 family membrane-anchored ribosome-binding protein